MVGKPSDKEEEYFIRQELERIKRLRDEHQAKVREEERRAMKELHFMHCAKCGQKMETTSLQEVDIEVCPDCGGIYLDAGELAKIVDGSKHGPFANTLATVRRIWGELSR